MSRRFIISASAIILIAALVGGTIGRSRKFRYSVPTNSAAARTHSDDIEKDFNEALSSISESYAGNVDYEKATQAAIQGMLSTLDPHSMYFPYNEFKKLKEDQDSRFYGIGVTIVQHRDGVYVQSAVEGTPAGRLGLRYGDRILEVDGQDAREWTSEQVSKKVRGGRGEPVTLRVDRAGSEAPLNFTIIRDSVPLPSIRNAYMLRPGTGYVGLTGGFQSTSDEELREAIDKLKAQGMRQLVLDLRNNPGGLLNQAIDVASEFLPRGQVVVSVKGRTDYSDSIVYKSSGSNPEDVPLVVLINRGSASASEIVAGAIQDHGRGLIVGETSFGKGLVQHVFQLPFNTGLTLTTARYYTPYGRSLQRDYSSGSLYDYYTRHDEAEASPSPSGPSRPSRPSGPSGPSGSPGSKASPSPVAQASATPLPNGPAVTTAANRVFYGGGGITPDIDVKPMNITPVRNRIAEAAFQFTRRLAAGLVPGLDNYKVQQVQYGQNPKAGDFAINERVIDAFRTFLRTDTESRVSSAQVDEDIDFVKLRLREEIVTAAFSNDAGARVLLDSDPQVLRALEALPDARKLAESIRTGAIQS